MPRALVTGASGFIGSHLCELLLRRGYEVVGLVRPTSDIHSLHRLSAEFPDRFGLMVGDTTDRADMTAAVKGVDFIFHLAAKVMGTSEAEFRRPNVTGTENLLNAAKAHCPNLRRFLLVSSQAAAGPSPTPEPIDESRVVNPVSWYGRSKADAEALGLRANQDGLPVTIVRPVSVYGERETDLSGGSFPAVNAGLAPRIGLGEKTITVVYVGDLVQGMVAAAESQQTRGKIYFLADRVTITSGDLVRAVADALHKRVRIPVIVPAFFLAIGGVLAEWVHFFTRARPALTRDKAREIRAGHWAATALAAKRDFGWEAQVALPEGIPRATADWALRRKQAADLTAQPDRERAVQTYLLGVIAGLICEGTSYVARWYEFHPPWLIVVAVLGYFGAMVGTLAFLLARRAKLIQFIASAALFVAVELANNYVLHLWVFTGPPFEGLNPWVRAAILAVPVGLVPVAINAVVGTVYRTRLRIG